MRLTILHNLMCYWKDHLIQIFWILEKYIWVLAFCSWGKGLYTICYVSQDWLDIFNLEMALLKQGLNILLFYYKNIIEN
jgi:hypothetical protein